MNKTKQIILLVAGILLIGLASYYFDRRSTGEENQNIDASKQEISQAEPEQFENESPKQPEEMPKISPENAETKTNEEPKSILQPIIQNQTVTFIGKIYSTPKDDTILSKYDDYLITDSGEKYGLQAADMVGIEGLSQIINEVIVSYRDTGRIAQIKGVLFESADDVSGRQIRVEEIKDITN